ncbi:MAG: PAC2 family protein [Ilumatobacteraceae bacterium]
MHDESLRWLVAMPTLDAPVLVVALDGWIDAAGAARDAFRIVVDESDASPVAEFDDDVYLDFRARRPTMELREGLNSVLEWQRITLSVGRDGTGRDLLLLGGPEPDMSWHRFCRLVRDVAVSTGVRRMVHFGAYPYAVPHTRPTLLSMTSPSQDVLARSPFLRSSIDVPAGVAAVLEHELHSSGIEALGIWAQVPHYVASFSFPAASGALLDGLRTATDVVSDAAALRTDMIERGRRLDELIAGNAEHTRMIAQLETLYDDVDRPSIGQGPSPESASDLPSGEELVAELEAYLRDQE